MGRKCRVKDCLSDSKRSEDVGVTFHKIPNHSDIRPKWLTLCKIPLENNSNKIIYVCSRHFRKHDFCQFKGTKYMLKQGVLPSIFPWTDLNEIKSKILSEAAKSDTAICNKMEDLEVTNQINLKSDTNTSSTKSETFVHTSQKNTEGKLDIDREKSELQSDIKTEPEKSDTKLTDTNMSSNFKCFKEEFSQGMRVEATDFNGIWFPAKVLEVDQSENEVFIQFEKSANRSNEWIPMDSKRLRPLQFSNKKQTFEVGERVMAMWTNSMKFRATIQKVLDCGDSYEVLFDDGIKSVLKSSKISKPTSTIESAVPRPHPSPLFAPVESTKQERRDRKRKIIVSELFHKKRVKQDSLVQSVPIPEKSTSSLVDKTPIDKPRRSSDAKATLTNVLASNAQSENVLNNDEWICQWINGQPVGTPGVIDSRKSVIVTDHRLPPSWTKHLVCRSQGFSAGKWDTILVNADGRKFRSKNEVKLYLEQEKSSYSLDQFDFGLHLKRARSLGLFKVTEKSTSPTPKDGNSSVIKQTTVTKSQSPKHDLKDIKSPERLEDNETFTDDDTCENTLKIICEDGGYKCPIEGCGKNFRRENLAQMHIKHYHPEFSKFIGSTPNVADLAYARTVGEPIEDFVLKGRVNQGIIDKKSEPIQKTPTRIEPKFQIKSLNIPPQVTTPTEKKSPIQTPKVSEKINEGNNDKSQPTTPKVHKQESEIIKLLNSETKIPKTQDAYKIESKLSKNDAALSPIAEQTTNLSKSPLIVTPLDPIKTETIKTTDVQNKDSAKSPDSIFKRDESRPSGGIKTLLPVIRVTTENQRKPNEDQPQSSEVDNHNKLQISTTSTPEKNIRTNRKRYISEADLHKKRKYTKHDYSYLSDPRDSDSRSPDYTTQTKNKKKSVDFADVPASSSTVTQDLNQHIITENGEVIKIEQMKQEEIVNCTCGFMEEDGLMIQCELCLCWQHAYCNNIEREDQVPEKYICYICMNPLRMRSSQKYVHDQDWLKKGVLPTANYHSVDKEVLNERFEKLRRSHELSGNLNELRSVLHSLKVKIKIAQNKDHPKFYLWSKPWEKINMSHNVKDLLDNQQNKSDIKDKSLCSNQTYVNYTEDEMSTHNDIELSLKKLLNCSTDSLKRETDNKIFDDSLSEVADIKDVNSSQQTAQDLLKILEGTDILKHSETETLVTESQESDMSKEKLLNTEYSKLDLNSLLVNTNIDSVNVDIDLKTERGTSVNDLTATINPNELEAVLRSDLSEDKVLTPLDEHSKSAFYDTIKSENKSISFTTDATDVSMHSGVISSGEVSDGELMSQALAGELLSSPTTALNLNFTQSDIDTIEKSIRIPEAPVPEAKIEPEVCRQNLIDNIRHYQQLVKERMNAVEEEIAVLEAQDPTPENEGNINETVTMMLRDLSQMQKLAALY